jgi:hypothetical protein
MIFIFFGALIPFLLIQMLQGKKSLTLAAVLITTSYYYCMQSLRYADSPAAGLADAFVGIFYLGLASGWVTKVTIVILKTKKLLKIKELTATLIGTLLIPITIYAPTLLHQWKQREPSSRCAYDTAHFNIDNLKLQIPTISNVSASNGNGILVDDDDYIAFIGNADLRHFCSISDNGKTSIDVNMVSISFNRTLYDSAKCLKAQWPENMCIHSSPLQDYPNNITIYNKNRYAVGGGDIVDIQARIKKATSPSDIAGFARDGNNFYWADTQQPPFALSCYKSGSRLTCNSNEQLAENIYVKYSGMLSITDTLNDARKLRKQTLQFLKEHVIQSTSPIK